MTGWIYPNWLANNTLLRSFSGAVMTDDAVFTPRRARARGQPLDPWFFDDQQGFGVDDISSSRATSPRSLGIAGCQQTRSCASTGRLMGPFGAPDWNHRPFYERTTSTGRAALLRARRRQFREARRSRPVADGLAYGTADGIWIAALPDLAGGLPDRRSRHAGRPQAGASRTGGPPTSRPRAHSREGSPAPPRRQRARTVRKLPRRAARRSGKTLKLALNDSAAPAAQSAHGDASRGRTLATTSAKVGASGRVHPARQAAAQGARQAPARRPRP